METRLKDAIKRIIRESYETQIKDTEVIFACKNAKNIGREFEDFSLPIIKVKVPKISKTNGRTYYHTEAKRRTYIYTQDIYEEELTKELDKIKIHVFQVNTDDSRKHVKINNPYSLSEEEIDYIYNMYNPYFRDKLVDFEIRFQKNSQANGLDTYQGIYPVFKGETNKEFYDAIEDYCRKKAEWCDKYGCD